MFQILLAEDNPGDVLLFREALNSCEVPCNIVVAADGQKAINLLGVTSKRVSSSGAPVPNLPVPGPGTAAPVNTWHPHLIVLDVNLPKYNGDAVLRHIRQQPSLQNVPVIMLTSSASPADRTSAINLGADLYLQKSSDLDELLEVGRVVQAILTRSSARHNSV